MSTTISAIAIQLAVVLLPAFGVVVGTEQLTGAIQTITVIATGLWVWYQRWMRGDVKWFGGYK